MENSEIFSNAMAERDGFGIGGDGGGGRGGGIDGQRRGATNAGEAPVSDGDGVRGERFERGEFHSHTFHGGEEKTNEE